MIAHKHERRLAPAPELLQHAIQRPHRQRTSDMPEIPCAHARATLILWTVAQSTMLHPLQAVTMQPAKQQVNRHEQRNPER